MKKRPGRSYALFVITDDGHWVRVWSWETGLPWPAFDLTAARKIYQSILLAPYTRGWDALFELRPIKEVKK